MRAISMGKSRFQGAAPTAVNVTVRRRGLQISDRTRSQEAALVAQHGRAPVPSQGTLRAQERG
jgi:hypothetical protein